MKVKVNISFDSTKWEEAGLDLTKTKNGEIEIDLTIEGLLELTKKLGAKIIIGYERYMEDRPYGNPIIEIYDPYSIDD